MDSAQEKTNAAPGVAKGGYLFLGVLILGYIGIYLCRKNFSVAVPLLQEHFKATRAEVGAIASYSTIAYAAGKFLFGWVVDRLGGRAGFLGSLLLVAVFGALGGLAPTIGALAFLYSMNRFVGAAGWPAMVKLAPEWFPSRKLPFALALLSLSFVVGGACATLFAGYVAEASGNNWRAVMAAPSAVLALFIIAAFFLLPRSTSQAAKEKTANKGPLWERLRYLIATPELWIICALSFVLTLLREAFNTWTVDMIKTQGGAAVTSKAAAIFSTPYDLMGAFGILAVGWIYGRINHRQRQWLLCGMLAALAALIYVLPSLFQHGMALVTITLGAIGFLIYGPYSLLAGTLSMEVRGREYVGSVSGIVDGVGYFAGILAGAQFGRLVDIGGYPLAFKALAALTVVSIGFFFYLYVVLGRRSPERERELYA